MVKQSFSIKRLNTAKNRNKNNNSNSKHLKSSYVIQLKPY